MIGSTPPGLCTPSWKGASWSVANSFRRRTFATSL